MILMYHKVAPDSPTMWWVTVDNFYRQMCELSHKEVVYLDEYEPQNPRHVVITFDGVYQNVLTYAAPILKARNYPFELFVTSDYIGKTNEFDTGEAQAQFASRDELKQLVEMGGRLQWHTRSHPRLNEVTNVKVLRKELDVPAEMRKLDKKGFKWVAYPHSVFNDAVIAESRKSFTGGLSVIHGDDTDIFQLNRDTVVNESSYKKASIGVVIPSYNYGSFLVEAVESVLRQTRRPDKILISDDASSDNTHEVAQAYVQKYPTLISYNRNTENLGVVKHFNKAVSLIDTDYVCLLGADNRFRSDYLEKTAAVLDQDERVAVAYTDFALFGPKAIEMFDLMPHDRRGPIIENYYYVVQFPDFSEQKRASIKEANFIHGSSLYRKSVFDQLGGYQQKATIAEDHNLFYRMVTQGWNAQRVAEPLLEYRQHSIDQVNTKMHSKAELHFYKTQYHRVRDLEAELQRINSSKFWKLLNIYKNPKPTLKKYLKSAIHRILARVSF